MLRLLSISLILGCFQLVSAQQKDVLFNRDIYLQLEHSNNNPTARTHTGLKPLLENRVDVSHTMGYRADSTKYYYDFTKAFFGGHLIDIKKDDYRLIVDPQFEFTGGWELKNASDYTDTTRLYTNTRGFYIAGDIGEHVSFQTRFYENQSTFPFYLFQHIEGRRAVPGQGRPKAFGISAFDYGWATGKVSWSPIEELNVQFGNDRHFVGHGHRSMLLSDNAFNYPFLKLSALLFGGKVQYSTIFAKLQFFDRLETGQSSESLFYWKKATFNHLSVLLGPVQLGLFESTHWQTIDEDGVRPVDPMEWNPVIGVNTLSNGFEESGNKQLLGIDLKASVTEDIMVYAQYATDRPSEGRGAYQVGARVFDVLGQGLHLQAEYNHADPFMYMQSPTPMAYTHFGQEMAHPMGADFDELVVILDKQFNRFWFRAKLNMATMRTDTTEMMNTGSDLFRPLSEASDTGTLEQQLKYVETRLSYVLNEHNNMRFSVGHRWRELSPADKALQSSYLYVSLHTDLFNKYYDF